MLLRLEFFPIVNHFFFAILTFLIQRNLFLLYNFDLFLIFSITASSLVHLCLWCWYRIDLLLLFVSREGITGRERVWMWYWSLAGQKHDPFTVAVWLLGVDTFEHGLCIHFHFERLLLILIKCHHFLTFESLDIAIELHGIHLLRALNLGVLHASLRNVRLQLIFALLPAPLCLGSIIEIQIYQVKWGSLILIHALVHSQSFIHLWHLCCYLRGNALLFSLVLLLVIHIFEFLECILVKKF